MKMATATAFLIATVSTALWAGEIATKIHVKGMACPFCVYGIEKNLKKVEGVSAIQSDFKKSLFTVESERPLDVKALEQAVKDAGFSVDSIKAEAKP